MQTVRADCERTIEGEIMNAEQEKALREYLQEAIVPLIEQVLIKKLGQAMSFAAEQLIQPKREWVRLTDEEKIELWNKHENHWRFEDNLMAFTRAIEQALKEKNT